MGVGKLVFLDKYDYALSRMSNNSGADLIDQDDYINFQLGFAAKKPSSWYFNGPKEMYKLKNGMRFDVELDAVTYLWMNELPILTITRDDPGQEAIKAFSPGVTVYAYCHDEDKEGDFVDGFHDELDGFKIMFSSFELLSSDTEIIISEIGRAHV